MTAVPVAASRAVRPLTWVTLGVSLFVGAAAVSMMSWLGNLAMFTQGGGGGFSLVFYVLQFVLPVAYPVAIIMNVVAGSHGGVNRVLCIIGGIILLSPVLLFVIGSFL